MAPITRKEFPVFDCDSHVVEPPAIWDEYVPARSRAWIKTQFCFHTDSDLLFINGRVVPAARERSNAAEVGWARWDKKEVGRLTPGTPEWQARFGRVLGCRDPQARLRDMDALGTDQVMLFPTWFVRLALVRSVEAATVPFVVLSPTWMSLDIFATDGAPGLRVQRPAVACAASE